MAAEPGFEPGLRDPKSPVLPLHNSAFYPINYKLFCANFLHGAEGRARTDMKVTLQQFLRLPRLPIPPLRLIQVGAEAQNRTGDTRIFSPLLYRLSYLGT